MPAVSQLSTIFNTNPYYDDYSEDSGFLKNLFRPGFAIQARELTQLQSFLQVQVERLGSHVFENGSIVTGGGVADFKSNYIRINETLTSEEKTAIIGQRISNNYGSGSIVGRVIELIDASALDDDQYQIVVYVNETAGAFSSNNNIGTTGDNHTGITFSVISSGLLDAGSVEIPASGTDAISVTVDSGIYYVNGYFVKALKQTVTPYDGLNYHRVFGTPSAAIGFDVENTIITEKSDASLRDPASGYYNHNAPGSDRYKMDLGLVFKGFTLGVGESSGLSFDSPSFVELMRISNGAVTKRVTYTDYSQLDETLARRTYDESGSYTVTSPIAAVYSHGSYFSPADSTKFALAVSPYKSYMVGNETETISPSYLEMEKPRSKGMIFSEPLMTGLGSYIKNETRPYYRNYANSAYGSIFGLLDTDNKADIPPVVPLSRIGLGNVGQGQHGGHWAWVDRDSKRVIKTFQLREIAHDTSDYRYDTGETVWGPNIGNFRSHIFNEQNIEGATSNHFLAMPVNYTAGSTLPSVYNPDAPQNPTNEDLWGMGARFAYRFGDRYTDGEDTLLFPASNRRRMTNEGIVGTEHNSLLVRREYINKTSFTTEERSTKRFEFESEYSFASESKSDYSVLCWSDYVSDFDDNGVMDGTVGSGFVLTHLHEDQYEVHADTVDPKKLIVELTDSVSGEDDQDNQYYYGGGLEADENGGTPQIILIAPVIDNSNTPGNQIYRTLAENTVVSETVQSSSVDADNYVKFYLANSHIKSINDINDNGPPSPNTFTIGDEILDDGQLSDRIEAGSIRIHKDNLNIINTSYYEIIADYTYYVHSGKGPITVNSYIDAGINYEDIPIFVDKSSGKRHRLTDYLDYRLVSTGVGSELNEDKQTYISFGLPFTKGVKTSKISYEYFKPRSDSVVLSEDGILRVVQGLPSVTPLMPKVLGKDMEIFRIHMDPYVFDLKTDIRIEYINNQRTTMSQINETNTKKDQEVLYQRQRDIEEEGLSAVSQISGIKSIDSPGIFVDDFTGFAFSDCSQRSFNCSMDLESGGMCPPFETIFVPVNTTVTTGLVKSSEGMITHKYNTVSSVSQTQSTFYINPNPYGVKSYLGYARLEPFGDFKYSLTKNPVVSVNTIGENDARFIEESSYGKYQYGEFFLGKKSGMNIVKDEHIIHWVGRQLNAGYSIKPDPYTRSYRKLPKPPVTLYPNRILRQASDRTIDESISPYMTATGITFRAESLKPGSDGSPSRVYAFMDGITIGDGLGYLVGTTGECSGHIAIPADTFITGVKNIRLSDSAANDLASTTTALDAQFYAQGSLSNYDTNTTTIRPMPFRRRSVLDESTISDILTDRRDASLQTVKNYIDPLCQIFVVDGGPISGTANGIVLDSVDLGFATKDDVSSGSPITVCIRPTINGKPHPNKEIASSRVTLIPAELPFLGSGDSSMTNFKFPSPVYLPAGEYALSIETDSSQYQIHAARNGENLLNSEGGQTTGLFDWTGIDAGGIIVKSVYLPQNNGSRREDKNAVLKMKINRCVFASNTYTDAERSVNLSLDMPNMYAPHLPSTQETTNFSSLTLVSNDPANSNPLSIPAMSITFNGSGIEPIVISPNNMQYFSYLGNNKFNLVVDDSDLDDSQKPYAIGGTDFNVVLPSSSANTSITPFFDTERLGIIAQDTILANTTSQVNASMKNWIRVIPGSDYGIDYYPTSVNINAPTFINAPQTRYISRIARTSLPCDTILVHIKLLEAEWSGFEVYFRSNANGSIDNANWRMLWVDDDGDGIGDDTTPGPGDWDGWAFQIEGVAENSYTMAPTIDDLNPPIGDFTQYQIKINFIGLTNPDMCIKQLTAMPGILN